MYQSKEHSRRQLFKGSIASVVAASWLRATSQAESKPAASRPKWTIACRDANLRTLAKANIFSAMEAIDVDGVEVQVELDGSCPNLFEADKKYSIANKKNIKILGDALRRHKKKITAFCLANRFDERTEEEVDFVAKTARAAVALGVPAIRLDIVPRRLKDKEDEFLKFAVETGRRIIKETNDTKVRFGIENHGGTTNKPEFLRKLFKGVGSKRFGLTLDTANFYWFGHPLSKLYEIYSEFAPWVCHTHCKSIQYPKAEQQKRRQMGWEYGKYACPIYEGDIDFKRLVAVLNKNSYTGDLCIENESLSRFPKEQHQSILAREAAFLRRLLKEIK
ncbi:MAG: sugar phosphate isomerase/epimerase [Planctomycetota bacterium]|nr:MAG: sugar phosphate isomerase/epimerase [Planctomycetota bacterium]